MRHTYVIGKTGQGKSTILERWAIDDIYAGDGVCFIDPHGTSVEQILLHMPLHRRNDVLLLDFADTDYPISINPLYSVPKDDFPKVATAITDVFKVLLKDFWGPYPNMLIYMGVLALLHHKGSTLHSLKYFISNSDYRKRVLKDVTDNVVLSYWLNDFEGMSKRDQQERPMSTLNKLTPLIADDRIANILGQPKMSFDFLSVIEEGKILLVSVPESEWGTEKSSLLGSLILSMIHTAAMRRTGDKPFHIYLDEAYRFGKSTLPEMLSTIRKQHVSITLAHQYTTQFEPHILDAILGNVDTLVAFALGATDAKILDPVFGIVPHYHFKFSELAPYTANVKEQGYRKIRHVHMQPTPAKLYPAAPNRIRRRMRAFYARPREEVEKRLAHFHSNV